MNKCVICKNNKTKVIFVENEIDVLMCKKCGHVFSSYIQKQNYDGYFGDEDRADIDNFWWKDAHERMYEDFCEKFICRKNGRLLDVGCGLGYFVKKISEFKSWYVEGCEISKVAVDYAHNKLGLDNVHLGKAEELDFSPKYFDVITMWDVIEHIPDPDPILKYLNKILKDDGYLFIHTPNINIQLPKARIKKFFQSKRKVGIHYLEARDHINIYSSRTIKKVLQNNGFDKIDFVHLYPIQSASGSKNRAVLIVKNIWYNLAKIVYKISFKKINVDNLFVTVRKK
jgi:2-polyprenyl-3-methyl-5-hydroxy-6-metoxy-1,4-benzoquinol methylase